MQANGSTDAGWGNTEPMKDDSPWLDIDEADCSELDVLIDDEVWISEEPWCDVGATVSLGRLTFL